MSVGFEVSGKPFLLDGQITHTGIHEVTDPVMPTTIIRDDQDWYVHLKWELNGSLASIIDGDWRLQLFLESIGEGFEGEVNAPGATVPVNPGGPTYEHKFEVKAGDVEPNNYKAVLWLRYLKPDGTPGPMSGFYEVPLIQIYKASP